MTELQKCPVCGSDIPKPKLKNRLPLRYCSARCASLRHSKQLSDKYIVHLLNMEGKNVPKSIILMKREQMLIYRSVKQLIQTIKENQND